MQDCAKKGRTSHIGHPGDKNGAAKLTWEYAREIRMLHGKLPRAQIAKKYKVSLSTIKSIVNTKSWVEPPR